MFKGYEERKEYFKKYYQERKEEKRKYGKKYYLDTRMERLEYGKKYRQECKEGVSKRRKNRYRNKRSSIHIARGHWNFSGGRPVHCVIAEKVLGRSLKQGEVVHHVDGNGLNNHHKNLLICANGYHNWLEREMSRLYKFEHFRGRCGKSVIFKCSKG